jgi:hypothetical protein
MKLTSDIHITKWAILFLEGKYQFMSNSLRG